MYYSNHIFICINNKDNGRKCCQQANAEDMFAYLRKTLKQMGHHCQGQIHVSKSGCLGRCEQGPCVLVYPQGKWFTYQSYEDIDIILAHIKNGAAIEQQLVL